MTRRRRILLALLPLCILAIAVVPVFLNRVARGTASSGEAAVRVTASLDGKPWSGVLEFSVSGSEEWLGSMVPYEIRLPPGVYGIRIAAGGPHNATPIEIVPLESRYVGAGEIGTFTVAYDGSGT